MKTKALPSEVLREGFLPVLRSVAASVLSLLLGAAQIFGMISPFGAAAVGGLPVRYAISGAIGAIVGSMLFAPAGRTGYLISIVLLVLAARLILARFIKKKLRPGFLCMVTLGASSLCALGYGILNQPGLNELLLIGVEIMLSSSLTYFFAAASEVLLRRRLPAAYTYAQKASICILYICTVCSAAGIRIGGVNFGVILGALCIYIAIDRAGIMGGCFVTIMTAIGLNLYSLDMLVYAGILVTAAFIAGAFAPLGRFAAPASFIAISVFALFLLGAPASLTWRMVDIFAAAALYLLLPDKLLQKLSIPAELSQAPELDSKGESPSDNFAAKLAFASETIRDLEQELVTVSDHFQEIDYNNIGTIYDAAAAAVCQDCARSLECWESRYDETVDAFHPVSDRLRLTGKIETIELPEYFQERCCRQEKLCQAVNHYYAVFVDNQNQKRQTAEARRIVFEQFNSIADMLLEVSDELGEVSSFEEKLTRTVREAYERIEKRPEHLLCQIDRFGRCRVEIYTTEVLQTSPAALAEALSEAADRDFDLPCVTHTQEMTRVSLFERARYAVEVSSQQSCCKDNSVCGDSCDYFADARGYAYLLLSDGMGSGKRAAIDSVMTCSILGKLIKAGFGVRAAVRMLNSSLLIKSTDESLATIDLVRLDLYTGKAEFHKAGAATTFLYSGGRLARMESEALPVGILSGAEAERQEARLHDGDLIVMVSDGALGAGEGWLAETIRQNSQCTAKELSKLLCSEAKHRTQEVHPDDITVVAARLRQEI